MQTIRRHLSIAAALGAALLFTACTTQSAKGPRVETVTEFTVVESSSDQELSPQQLAEMREAILNYLQSQGLTGQRLYYVKVSFPPADPEGEPQWAVVRIANVSAQTYTVLAAYPGRDDYYPYDYYRYGSYNPAYAGFSRWGYYDPYDYNYGGYSRPAPPYHNHGRPNQPNAPEEKPAQPAATRARWENPRAVNPDQQRPTDRPVRTANPERWSRERAERPERAYTAPRESGGAGFSRSESRPAPAPSYTPAPSPAPVRSEAPAPSREEYRSASPQNERQIDR